MTIAVCDDEKIICEQIKDLIKLKRTDAVIELYHTGEALLAALLTAGKSFDIIFLDIQMEGLNGIETARKLRKTDARTVLIFITGIREAVFEAFDVHAFHYLLKPVQEGKFWEVFTQAEAEAARLTGVGQAEKLLWIKNGKRRLPLRQDSILYIENRAKKLEIHTKEGVVETYASMKDAKEQLADAFFRCHRGYLVNMAYITEYDYGSITLTNGEIIYMAKEKYSLFVKQYLRYLRNGGQIFGSDHQ